MRITMNTYQYEERDLLFDEFRVLYIRVRGTEPSPLQVHMIFRSDNPIKSLQSLIEELKKLEIN